MLTTTSRPFAPPAAPTPSARRGQVRKTTPVDGPSLVSAHLESIQEAIRLVSRLRSLSNDEAEELSSAVYLKLLQNDGAVLRKFRGDGSLRAFLVVVVRRVLLDLWIARRGKWRPSRDAKQLGTVAVELERLVFRDGMSITEAGETIRIHLGVDDSDAELTFLLALLPTRLTRRFVADDSLANLPSTGPDPLELLLQHAQAAPQAAVEDALAALDADDRLLMTLRFEQNLTVAQIARLRGTDSKALYRRFERVLRRLRVSVLGHPQRTRRTQWRARRN